MTCPGGRCQKGIVVPARGPVDSVVVVLGESPGKTEAERGLPFVGPSGQLLNEAANATDFPLAGCYITNSCKAFVVDDPNPTKTEIDGCLEHVLTEEIESHERLLIVALGNVAAYAAGVIPRISGIMSVRGKIVDSRFRNPDGTPIPVLPTLHPSYILRGGGGELQILLQRDLETAVRYIRGEDLETETISNCEFLSGTDDAIRTVINEAKTTGFLAVDLETDGLNPRTDYAQIVGIAMCGGPGHSLFARTPTAQERAVRAITALYGDDSVLIVGHNSKFDAQWLTTHYSTPPDLFDWDTRLVYNLLAEEGVSKSSDDGTVRRGLKALAELYLNWPRYSDEIDRYMSVRTPDQLDRAEIEVVLSQFEASDRTFGGWASNDFRNKTSTRAFVKGILPNTPAVVRNEFADRVYDALVQAGAPVLMSSIPPQTVFEYACKDALATYLLAEKFKAMLADEDLIKTEELVIRPVMRVFDRIMARPLYVDKDLLTEVKVPLATAIAQAETKVRVLAGNPGLNPGSTKQLAKVLYDQMGVPVTVKTDSGAPSTAEDALLAVLSDPDVGEGAKSLCNAILHFRRLSKMSSSYIDNIIEFAEPYGKKDWVVWPDANLAGTVTGRLSYVNPAVQTIPSYCKAIFLPHPGHVLIDADLSQAEVRVAVMYSLDPGLIHLFKLRDCPQCGTRYEGERICPTCRIKNVPVDLYTQQARLVYEDDSLDKSAIERALVKKVFLATMYGQSPASSAAQLGVSVEKADEALTRLRSLYPTFFEYFDRIEYQVSEPPYEVRSMFGRKRRLRAYMTSQDEAVRAQGVRMAKNAPIQSASSDMVCLRITELDQIMRDQELNCFPILFVHDSVVLSCEPKHVPQAIPIIEDVMTRSPVPEVMLDVEVKVGIRYGSMGEMMEFVGGEV